MYKPIYSKRFTKQIKKFPKKEQIKILNKIISITPDPRSSSIKLETTNPPIYRVRAGEYRIMFEIEDKTQEVIITDVERRTTQTYHLDLK